MFQTLFVHIVINIPNDQTIGYIVTVNCIFFVLIYAFVIESHKHRGRRADACLFKQEPHDHLVRNVLCFSNGSQPSQLSSATLQIRD